jgi:hypothetical protein
MKKHFIFLGTFLFYGICHSQNTFPTAAGTNVGIGTTTPSTRLQITSPTVGTSGVRLTNLTSSNAATTGNNLALSVDNIGNIILTPVVNNFSNLPNIYNSDGALSDNRTVFLKEKNINFLASDSNSNLFVNGKNGRVGIGNIIPYANLDIKGGLPDGNLFETKEDMYDKSMILNIGSYVNENHNRRNLTFMDIPSSNFNEKSEVHLAIEDRSDANRFRFIGTTNGNTWFALSNKLQEEIFTISENEDNVKLILPKQDSYIGIGTNNFYDGNDIFRLSVKGAIRADRVKVYTSWADFVFEKNYKLPTIEQVEKQIIKNGHLKDIPSASDVEKNGIDLGEINKKLLQKIEELTPVSYTHLRAHETN